MQDFQKVRFITINYSNLQGLRAIPISLLLLLIVLWVNLQKGPARDFTVPILIGLSAAILYWWIDRYYKSHYGRVERTTRQQRFEYALGVLGGLSGLVAVIIDFTYKLPVSMVGFVFTAAILVEFLRTFRFSKSVYYFWQAVVSFTILLAVNFLPLLGWKNWGQVLGMRDNFLAVLVVTSLVILIAGLCGHVFFIIQFQSKKSSQ